MDKLHITGGTPLMGEVKASGAKNAVLPIIAATLLTPETCIISNVPTLRDVFTSQKLLTQMGAVVRFDDGVLTVDAGHVTETLAPYDLVKTMRASVLVMGPLLARFGKVTVSLPGGCAIGARPIDQHLKGFEAMGASIAMTDGNVCAKAPAGGLKGAHVVMDLITVTGTENLLMAAVLAEGETVLENAAREPEVSDLAHCLNKMGANITGIDTDTLVVQGVKTLRGCEYAVMPDRIESATYLVGAAITGGCVTVTHADPSALDAAMSKLAEAGATVESGDDWIRVDMRDRDISAVTIRTAPHPAFPTDLQAQFMALNAVAKGSATITETIFENRFMHVPELERMGAHIRVDGRTATVTGVDKLTGAPVMATDLRASASLVLAALAAEGTTVIDRVYHLDRGYEKIEAKLGQLGAKISRTQG